MYIIYYKSGQTWYKSSEAFNSVTCSRIRRTFYSSNEVNFFEEDSPEITDFDIKYLPCTVPLSWQASMVTPGNAYLRVNTTEGETAKLVFMGLKGYAERPLGFMHTLIYTAYEDVRRDLVLVFRFSPTQCEEYRDEREALSGLIKLHSYSVIDRSDLKIIETLNRASRYSQKEVDDAFR